MFGYSKRMFDIKILPKNLVLKKQDLDASQT